MTVNEEIIDVEEFHSDLQCRSENGLQEKYRKFEDYRALVRKCNNISHLNDKLYRQVFDMTQGQCRVAKLLGFDDFDSVEKNLSAGDPWIPGGQSRIFQLEKDIATHAIESAKEIQTLRIEMEEQLKDVHNEAERLRRGRDFAREEAERQAVQGRKWSDELQVCREELQRCRDEVQMWRNEVNTRLPEMLALIQEQRVKLTQSDPPHKQIVAGSSPLRSITNSPPSPNNDCTHLTNNGRDYKREYESLEVKYNTLLASKKKVSQRYFEDLKKWKAFKDWIVADRSQHGRGKRPALKRRKVMEEIGPQDDASAPHVKDVSMLAIPRTNGPGGVTAVSDLDSTNIPKNVDKPTVPVHAKPQTRSLSPFTRGVSPSCSAALGESLTQPPSTPTTSQDRPYSAVTPKPSSISRLSEQLPLSQESVTQPSSTPPSPIDVPITVLNHLHTSPDHTIKAPEALSSVPNRDSGEQLPLMHEPEYSSKEQITTPSVLILQTQVTRDYIPHKTPTVIKDIPVDRKNHLILLPASEPPTKFKSSCVDQHFPRSDIQRTCTVFATDTPPRPGALVRHHSSPPSPHVSNMNLSPTVMRIGKRKVADMEDANENLEDGNDDPFVASDSRVKIKPQGQKLAYARVSGKQSRNENLTDYMQYKGRGRYSSSTTTSAKTVNANFEINPARNGGVNYQYDGVVRDKATRKTLEAGDCESCRDYYEAVGPLPPRLQPPVWRSPSRSRDEDTSRPCRHNGDNTCDPALNVDARAKAIKSHKHEVSRHRYDWAPPTTPPSYWHIGFPDTQEVENINQQANDMHTRKLKRIEVEAASKNGRYRRR